MLMKLKIKDTIITININKGIVYDNFGFDLLVVNISNKKEKYFKEISYPFNEVIIKSMACKGSKKKKK